MSTCGHFLFLLYFNVLGIFVNRLFTLIQGIKTSTTVNLSNFHTFAGRGTGRRKRPDRVLLDEVGHSGGPWLQASRTITGVARKSSRS